MFHGNAGVDILVYDCFCSSARFHIRKQHKDFTSTASHAHEKTKQFLHGSLKALFPTITTLGLGTAMVCKQEKLDIKQTTNE